MNKAIINKTIYSCRDCTFHTTQVLNKDICNDAFVEIAYFCTHDNTKILINDDVTVFDDVPIPDWCPIIIP